METKFKLKQKCKSNMKASEPPHPPKLLQPKPQDVTVQTGHYQHTHKKQTWNTHKSAGVVISHCLCIAKGLQQRVRLENNVFHMLQWENREGGRLL